MHKLFRLISLMFIILLCFFACSKLKKPATNIKCPVIFGDNMVLQQKVKIPVWGTADPGGKLTVKMGDQEHELTVPSNGKWRTNLSPMPAGGPFSLVITGQDTITFANVLIGEVWLASGQSNMEWRVENSDSSEKEIAAAHNENIRLFTVKRNMSNKPLDDVTSEGWKICSPQTVGEFSAVAYFFGRNLYENLNVPIGLVHSSWGGTVAEAWTSGGSLEQLEDFTEIVKQLESAPEDSAALAALYENQLADWDRQVKAKMAAKQNDEKEWQAPDMDVADWPEMEVPGLWEQGAIGGFDGIVWFRKEIMVPLSWAGQNLTLYLGPIDDFDKTWFNGVLVGHMDQYNSFRTYTVPDSIVKEGKNIITVQVTDTGGGGGFWGKADTLKLEKNPTFYISLAGNWKYRVGPDFKDLPSHPQSPTSPNRPMVLYNAMLHPLIPYAIRGAIWYQGESNASRAYQYRTLFPAMIQDWRKNWRQGDFPFFFVQLSNYRNVADRPVNDDWAELREAQTMALSLPHTGMAVTIDIGEADDIHPRNKQDVGKRLALNARALVYGENITFSGPIYKSMQIDSNKIRLTFEQIGAGLVTPDDEPLKGFAIAGRDSNFVWAEAVIDKESVVVWSPEIADPIAVRYAWASNPVCNLYNKDGLPASPFRTDDWPGITMGVK
ncbi:9-O-acetylesterase [candidate division KSB1 bacterium]|nr:9-O-acetylesterase [candidate division KSB1 bacterium]